MYISAVQKDIIRAYQKHRPIRSNLFADERHALELLRENSEIIIKPADKGRVVVVLDKAEYLKEGFRQSAGDKFYRELSIDLTRQFEVEIKDILCSLEDDGE